MDTKITNGFYDKKYLQLNLGFNSIMS